MSGVEKPVPQEQVSESRQHEGFRAADTLMDTVWLVERRIWGDGLPVRVR